MLTVWFNKVLLYTNGVLVHTVVSRFSHAVYNIALVQMD